MPEANLISEHMEVIGSDGGHVGTVDHLEDGRIKLTRSDSGDGQHHYIDTALVQDIRGNTVTLTKSAADALQTASGEGEEPGDDERIDPQMGVATNIG